MGKDSCNDKISDISSMVGFCILVFYYFVTVKIRNVVTTRLSGPQIRVTAFWFLAVTSTVTKDIRLDLNDTNFKKKQILRTF